MVIWVFAPLVGAFLGVIFLYLIFALPVTRGQIVKHLSLIAKQGATRLIEKVKKKIPMAAAVLQGSMEEQLKQWMEEELVASLPTVESKLRIPMGIMGAVIAWATAFLFV